MSCVLLGVSRAAIALLVALSAVLGAATAQAQTADQVKMLQSLSPEQREALQQQLRNGGVDSGSAARRDRPADAMPRERQTDDERKEGRDGQRRIPPEPKLQGDDLVLIEVKPIDVKATEGRSAADSQRLQQQQTQEQQQSKQRQIEDPSSPEARAKRIRERNPYRLDRDGVLNLPGLPGILLTGLTVEQGTKRLALDPLLQGLQVTLTLLPVRKPGAAGLQPFGYDLFNQPPSWFAPVTDIAAPADYVVGIGDELQVQLYGSQNRGLRLTVDRDGRVSLPELGPIVVAGRRFSDVRSDIEGRVSTQIVGTRANVSLGDLRSIRVFVLGEALIPGSYTISGLATMTSALFAAGGVKPIGSLRDIQLRRQGALVRRLDLYDLLQRGDSSNDARLQPGDVIFVPPIGATVAVDGEVRRPAIYEVKGGEKAVDLIALAGGLTNDADPTATRIERVNPVRGRSVIDVNLSAAASRDTRVERGDFIRVARARPTLDAAIVVDGYVHRPGPMAWRQGLRLTDILTVDELKPGADANYIVIRRELQPDRQVKVLSADLSAALRAPKSPVDLELAPRDRIIVFDYTAGREQLLDPVVKEINRQSRAGDPARLVIVEGQIKVPGTYPFENGMTVTDLVRAGGGLSDAAFGASAELIRYPIEQGERKTQLIEIDLQRALSGDREANLALQSSDRLLIKITPRWTEQERVTLRGEVRFPGVYAIRKGETLRSVLARAGGLNDIAFARGAVFTRVDLREREQKQLDELSVRLQSDISALALQAAAAIGPQTQDVSSRLAAGQALLAQVRSTPAVGRLAIDLDAIVARSSDTLLDIVLRDGDELAVPRVTQTVSVLGEVFSPVSHQWRRERTVDDYLSLSGGETRRADLKRVYVVRANGTTVPATGRGWFASARSVRVEPGDAIVVPVDVERVPQLSLWQGVTQILYNAAVALLAIRSL